MRSSKGAAALLMVTTLLAVLLGAASAAVSPEEQNAVLITPASSSSFRSRHLLEDEPFVNAGASTTTSGSGGGSGGGSLVIGTESSSDVLMSANPATGVTTTEANAMTGGGVDVLYTDTSYTESDSISDSNILPNEQGTSADALIRIVAVGDTSGERYAGSEAGTKAAFVDGPTVSFDSGAPEVTGSFGSSLAMGIAAAAAGGDSEANTDIQAMIDTAVEYENEDGGFALSEALGMGSTGGSGTGPAGSSSQSFLDLTADVDAMADTTTDNFFLMSTEALANAQVNGNAGTEVYSGFTTTDTQLDGETYSYATDAGEVGVGGIQGALVADAGAKGWGDAHVYSLGKSLYGIAKSGGSLDSIAGAEATYNFNQNPLPGIARVQGDSSSYGGGMAYGYAKGNLFEKSYSDVYGETEADSEAFGLQPATSGASGMGAATVEGTALGTDVANLYYPLVFSNAEGLALSSSGSNSGVNGALGEYSSGGSSQGNGYVSNMASGLYSETNADVTTEGGESSSTYAILGGLGVGATGGAGGSVDTEAMSKGIGFTKTYADGSSAGSAGTSGAWNPITGAFIATSGGNGQVAGDSSAVGNLFTYTGSTGQGGASTDASAVDLAGSVLGAGGLGATATGGFAAIDFLDAQAYGADRGYAASTIGGGAYSDSDAVALASAYEIVSEKKNQPDTLAGEAYTASKTTNYVYGDASSAGRYKSTEALLNSHAGSDSISGSASLQQVTSGNGKLFASGQGAGTGLAAGDGFGSLVASTADDEMFYTSVQTELGTDASSGLTTLSGSSNTAGYSGKKGPGKAQAFGSNEIFADGTGQAYGMANAEGQQSMTGFTLEGSGETFVVGGNTAFVEYSNGPVGEVVDEGDLLFEDQDYVLSLGIADGEGEGGAMITAEAYGPSTSVVGSAGGSGYAGSESLGDSTLRVSRYSNYKNAASDGSGYGKGFSGANAATHGVDTSIMATSGAIGNTEGGSLAYAPNAECIEDGKDACITTFIANANSDSYLNIYGENAAGYLGDSAISVGVSPIFTATNAYSTAYGNSEGTFNGDGMLDADTYTYSDAIVSAQEMGVPGGNQYIYVTGDGLLVAGFADAQALETQTGGFLSVMEEDERDGSMLAREYVEAFGQTAAVGSGLSAEQVDAPGFVFGNGGGAFVGNAGNVLALVDATASVEPSGTEERLIALTRSGATGLGITVGDDTMIDGSSDGVALEADGDVTLEVDDEGMTTVDADAEVLFLALSEVAVNAGVYEDMAGADANNL